MKLNYFLPIMLIACTLLNVQFAQTRFSLTGTIDDLPSEIVEAGRLGGWINIAVDDGMGNVFISQSDLIHSATLNGAVDINYSLQVPEEARSMDYDNGRIVFTGWGWGYTPPVITFETGSSSALVESFTYNLTENRGIYRVDLNGNYLYIAESGDFGNAARIHIFDWSGGPNANDPIGAYNPLNAKIYDFVIAFNTIFIVGEFDGTDKLVVVDVTDKNNPFESASLPIENATSVGVDNFYIYVGCKSSTGNDGLKVLRFSDPTTIYKEAFRSLIDFDQIIIEGSRLYARDGRNLIIIDITNHDTGVDPQVLGSQTFNEFSYEIWGLSGYKLYYTSAGSFGAFDIMSPNNIFLSTIYNSPRAAIDNEMDGNYLVVVDINGKIFSYHFNDLSDQTLISTGNIPGGSKVFMYNNQCFIADNSKGIHIFDVNNLANKVGHYTSVPQVPAGADFIDMAFSNAACYAVGGKNLEIFDRTEDVAPGGTWPRRPLAQLELDSYISSVFLAGNALYVSHENGISVYNVESSTNPTLLNTFAGDIYPLGAGVDGDYLIVCSTDGGSTYLSAYDKSTNPPTFLTREKIADGVPARENYSQIMDIIDALILVVVENRVLSFVYLPGTNEFAAGPTYTDKFAFHNIKGHKPVGLSKSSFTNFPSQGADSKTSTSSQSSYGLKKLKYHSLFTKIEFISGRLFISNYDNSSLAIGRDAQGNVTINGAVVVDQIGNEVKADDVTGLNIYAGGSGSNQVDLSDVTAANFPNIPPARQDDPSTPQNESDYNITVTTSGGDDNVIAAPIGSQLFTTGGNDILQGYNAAHNNLNGGSGNDNFYFGQFDHVYGGTGNDNFHNMPMGPLKKQMIMSFDKFSSLMTNEFPDTLADESGIDTLDFSLNPVTRKINLDLFGVVQTVDEAGWQIVLNGQFEYYIGGPGNDVVTVKPLSVPRFVDGGGGQGSDTLYYDTGGLEAIDDGFTITVEGYAPITYLNFTAAGYKPEIASIIITPDTIILRAGMTYQFNARSFDTWGNEMHVDLTWTTTGGTVTNDGLFTAGSTVGTFTVTAEDTSSNIFGTAIVKIFPMLANIVVSPDSALLYPGDQQQYFATGFDSLNTECEVFAKWNAAGGIIDQTGLFIAGVDTGYYMVSAEDSLCGIQGGAVVYISPVVGIDSNENNLPTKFSLAQNYPNPFNPSTIIRYAIPITVGRDRGKSERIQTSLQHVILKVYDVLGRELETLVDEIKEPGYYNVTWEPKSLTSGVYFYRIIAGKFSSVRKMVFLK